MVARMIAARPEGTRCSDQTREPFPPTNRRAPTLAAPSQCFRSGGGVPRNRNITYISDPAITNLTPAIQKGGMVWTANLIAR